MTLGYLGPWDPGNLRLFGMVWFGINWYANEFIDEEISMLYCSEKFHGWVGKTLQL